MPDYIIYLSESASYQVHVKAKNKSDAIAAVERILLDSGTAGLKMKECFVDPPEDWVISAFLS
jgi:hypothetical protein